MALEVSFQLKGPVLAEALYGDVTMRAYKRPGSARAPREFPPRKRSCYWTGDLLRGQGMKNIIAGSPREGVMVELHFGGWIASRSFHRVLSYLM